MFSVLAAALLITRMLPEQRAGIQVLLGVAASAGVVAFPYLLFRFAETFKPVGRRWRGIAAAGAAVMVMTTVVAVWLARGESEPAWYRLFVLSVIAGWTAFTAWVVWRFWRAGQRQPALTRRRVRTMGVAAGLLNAALLLAGSGEGQVLQAAAQLIALSSAAAFLLAFSPPQSLRVLWRQPDERALWQAQGDLVAADTREAVVAAVLPHVARLVGGGAMFIDSGGEETAVGLEGPERARVRQRLVEPDTDEGADSRLVGGVAKLVLPQGRLGVSTSAYTPLFGQDELEVMGRLGGLLDLALHRVEASMKTSVLAAFEQGLIPEIDPPAGLLVDTRYMAGLQRLQLGGDFLDVVALPSGTAGLVIGDVSGHGPSEAAFAVGVHAGWRTLAKVDPNNPSTWLALLDETFFDRNPERFVTALAGRIDVARRTLTLVTAGHPPPIITGTDPHPVDVGPDPPLGIGHADRRKETTVTLLKGQGLLLYTDGLLEQRQPNQPDQRWEEQDLLDYIAEHWDPEDFDLDALLWHFGRRAFADDVAVMLLRFAPPTPIQRPAGD